MNTILWLSFAIVFVTVLSAVVAWLAWLWLVILNKFISLFLDK